MTVSKQALSLAYGASDWFVWKNTVTHNSPLS